MSQSVVIVGAGISGLATAYYLRQRAVDVTVLDASAQVGGKIHTVCLHGLPVDTGPDAFLSRGADLRGLIDDLGLTDAIVAPSSGSYIWSRGHLRRLPAGMAFGLPQRLWPLLRSGLLSPVGVARAGWDLVLPATRFDDDPSIADLVRPRFGTEVYQRLVEPLLGGVHAGDPAQLSARSTAPDVYALAEGHRSVYLSLRERKRARPTPVGPPSPPLVSLRGGLGTLVDALVDGIGADRVRAAVGVNALDGHWQVSTNIGTLQADTLVLAVPAHRAAPLVQPLSPALAGHLSEIPYVDVCNATLALSPRDVPALPPGTGFLVPPSEGEFIVGCTWLTNKWPYLANDGVVLIKCMAGRAGDTRWLTMSDGQIVDQVRAGLRRILGISAAPIDTVVQRWPQAMPQYVVGHTTRLAAIDTELAGLPGLRLTGSAYRGAGLAACVSDARATAERIAS